jgi:phospholipase C
MYTISPLSKGGWVNSQVFDHTSVGQFLEKRFGVHVPAISPWHRAVAGDLTSAFDFARPNDPALLRLPNVSNSAETVALHSTRPKPAAPDTPEPLFQERGTRPSRALPYELHVDARMEYRQGRVSLVFRNTGRAGAVFHVYDKLHLDRIPRRYTVEARKEVTDVWDVASADEGTYDLWVYGPNGFVREIKGRIRTDVDDPHPEVQLRYLSTQRRVLLLAYNAGDTPCALTLHSSTRRAEGIWKLSIVPHRQIEKSLPVADSGNWYDILVNGDDFERRFAGRVETGEHSTSDPAV